MSEIEKQKNNEPKLYESKVLLTWETPENIKDGKINFPKRNSVCRHCPHADYQMLEHDNNNSDEETEQGKEPIVTTRIECVCYCHDRYKEVHGIGFPNIIACDGFYKQPKE